MYLLQKLSESNGMWKVSAGVLPRTPVVSWILGAQCLPWGAVCLESDVLFPYICVTSSKQPFSKITLPCHALNRFHSLEGNHWERSWVALPVTSCTLATCWLVLVSEYGRDPDRQPMRRRFVPWILGYESHEVTWGQRLSSDIHFALQTVLSQSPAFGRTLQ